MPAANQNTESDASKFGRLFGDLRVRKKLIVLHNLFFLVLASAVYFSLIPRIEKGTAQDLARETALIREVLTRGGPRTPLSELEVYEHREGSAEELAIPPQIQEWLDQNPGSLWEEPARSEFLYRKDPESGRYSRIKIPIGFYEELMSGARRRLFLVLGAVSLLSVAAI